MDVFLSSSSMSQDSDDDIPLSELANRKITQSDIIDDISEVNSVIDSDDDTPLSELVNKMVENSALTAKVKTVSIDNTDGVINCVNTEFNSHIYCDITCDSDMLMPGENMPFESLLPNEDKNNVIHIYVNNEDPEETINEGETFEKLLLDSIDDSMALVDFLNDSVGSEVEISNEVEIENTTDVDDAILTSSINDENSTMDGTNEEEQLDSSEDVDDGSEYELPENYKNNELSSSSDSSSEPQPKRQKISKVGVIDKIHTYAKYQEKENVEERKVFRKRSRNPEKWIRETAKRRREHGEEYKSRAGKRVPMKVCKPITCNCKFKCRTKLSQCAREKTFHEYWKLNYDQQRNYIFNNVTKIEKRDQH